MKSRIATIAAPTLAAMAVPLLLSSPASAAAGCTQPVPTIETINHEAVTAQHPAKTHPEWSWSREVIDQPYAAGIPEVQEVSHLEFEYIDGERAPEGEGWWKSGQQWTIEDVAAYTDYGWMRHVVDLPFVPAVNEQPEVSHVVHHEAVTHTETVVDERAWDQTVVDHEAWDQTLVDREAYDEVAPNGYAYQQKTTDKIKYKDAPDWNGEEHEPGNDYGWFRVAALDKLIHHEAVTHTVHHDAVTHTVHHDAVTHVVTIVDHEAYDETIIDSPYVPGTPEQAEVSHDEFGWTRSNNMGPQGEGWFLTGESYDHEAVTHTRFEWMRKVIDQTYVPAVPEIPEQSHTETTEETSVEAPGAGWAEVEGSEVLVEDKAAYTETTKDAWIEYVSVTPDVGEPVTCDAPDGPKTQPAHVAASPTAHVATSQKVLPNTGAPAWLGAAGLAGTLLTAAGVLVLRREKVKHD